MIYKLAATVGAIAIVASALMTPAASLAQTTTSQKTYTTTLTQVTPIPDGGAWTGTLEITISADGFVYGWYIPDADATFILVTGSYKHGRMWLDIGQSGSLQINAVAHKNGKLVGSATDLASAGAGIPVTYDFEANPTRSY